VAELVGPFDPSALAYPWVNPDPRVDELHRRVVELVQGCQREGLDRRTTFRELWRAAFGALGGSVPPCDTDGLPDPGTVPRPTEAWYCCAEPTEDQLASI
jgi:hypothetical protein